MTAFYTIQRQSRLYVRKKYFIKRSKERLMEKNAQFEENFGLGIFCLGFLNILNRGLEE